MISSQSTDKPLVIHRKKANDCCVYFWKKKTLGSFYCGGVGGQNNLILFDTPHVPRDGRMWKRKSIIVVCL
jgi:hypothetical protein